MAAIHSARTRDVHFGRSSRCCNAPTERCWLVWQVRCAGSPRSLDHCAIRAPPQREHAPFITPLRSPPILHPLLPRAAASPTDKNTNKEKMVSYRSVLERRPRGDNWVSTSTQGSCKATQAAPFMYSTIADTSPSVVVVCVFLCIDGRFFKVIFLFFLVCRSQQASSSEQLASVCANRVWRSSWCDNARLPTLRFSEQHTRAGTVANRCRLQQLSARSRELLQSCVCPHVASLGFGCVCATNNRLSRSPTATPPPQPGAIDSAQPAHTGLDWIGASSHSRTQSEPANGNNGQHSDTLAHDRTHTMASPGSAGITSPGHGAAASSSSAVDLTRSPGAGGAGAGGADDGASSGGGANGGAGLGADGLTSKEREQLNLQSSAFDALERDFREVRTQQQQQQPHQRATRKRSRSQTITAVADTL